MMTGVYPEVYLNSAMTNLGDAFDYAVNDAGIDGYDFINMFISSLICRKLENGEPKYLVGKSGIELAFEIVEETTGESPSVILAERFDRTPDYWCGRAVCYYQWLTGLSYRDIFRIADYGELLAMYHTLHEADISKFANVMGNGADCASWRPISSGSGQHMDAPKASLRG